ncbi:MAG: Succinate-semialdehyde dehydrogenase [NADP(+)] GabD [Myxococcota bacterium]|nr:Succinate-semialdehyde dehydrogenase [NADP(+)] GabD [Myxococcota bacterium]
MAANPLPAIPLHAVPAPSERKLIEVRNPATGEKIGEVPEMTADEVRAAVARARAAQPAWAALSIEERCRKLIRYRELLAARCDEFAGAISRENGKPAIEGILHEVVPMIALTNYFTRRAAKILAPHRISTMPLVYKSSYIHYKPRGVVGIISPWNFPFNLPFGDVVMALIAGNGVVLKPSEVTPLIALKGKALMDEAGIPTDLFQVVTGRGQTGAAVIEAGVNKVVFTGSVATGKRIAAAAGERLIPVTLELGGKAPAIVLDDADLERTANALVWGGFANSGQVCASVERVLAHERIYDKLVEMVTERAKSLRQGDPAESVVDVGAVCFSRQLEVARTQVADAVEKGAKITAGGTQVESAGQYFQPTVLRDVTDDMRIMREESFSPLLPFRKITSEEEAIRVANSSHLGLLAYVFSSDLNRARRVAEQVQAGTVMINDVLASHALPATPWHGVKESGLGVVHSHEGLRAMCEMRHVNYSAWWNPKSEFLFWYPYSRERYDGLVKGVKFLFNGKLNWLVRWFS